MTEDRSFNAFLKAKLEEDVGEIPAVATFGRPRFRPYLLAASLAAVCCALTVNFLKDREAAGEQCAVQAIELLAENSVAEAETFAEKLLAWQDAPYDEIAN